MLKKIISIAGIFSVFISISLMAHAATLATPLTVGSVFPTQNGTTNISGSCGVNNPNNTVNFYLDQNGSTTTLASNYNLMTDSSGNFSGSIGFPQNYGSGTTTLVARCANGDILNSNTLTFPSPASTSFNLSNINPTVGGTFNVSQACGGSNGVGTAELTLNNNGAITPLGVFGLTPTGTFSGSVTIPSTSPTSNATITATCSNGASFSSPITIRSAAVTNLSLASDPVSGSTRSVTGVCTDPGTTPNTNANGTVSFSLMRGGMNTTLTAGNVSTNTNGNFSSTLNFPASYAAGPATLVVTCPNGANFATPITILASDMGGSPDRSLQIPQGSTGTTGSVMGISATPVGGVDAGAPFDYPVTTLNISIITSLLGAAAISFLISRRLSKK